MQQQASSTSQAPPLPVTKESARQRLLYLVRALGLVWASSRYWTVAWVSLLVLQGLIPAGIVYLTKALVDGVAAAIGGGASWEALQPVLLPAALMTGLMLLAQILAGLVNWIRTAQAEIVQDHVKSLVHQRAALVDLEFYETPADYDQMARANNQADSRSITVLQNLGSLLQNLITMVAISGLLISYGVWLPFVLFISTLPALWVIIRHNKFHHDWWEETTEKRRWVTYFDQVLTIRYFAAELRIFRLNKYFQDNYRRARRELRLRMLDLIRRQTIANFGAGVGAFIVTGGVMAWMLWRALHGQATLGDLALFYSAFNQGQGLMRSLLGNFGQLFTDTLFLKHLFGFLELEPRIKQSARPKRLSDDLRHGIEVRNVDFRYPGSQTLALRDFSLTIPARKIVAVVGPNGAGKSTLLKLLCRFYDPEEGSVQFDGVDIRETSNEDLWSKITILFQEYVNYAGSIAESIRMSDLYRPPDAQRLSRAAIAGGAAEVVERYPDGFATILGKQFRGGVDLSSGQFQRLALSRAFYRDAPLVLLDEPTSYMDSWAEAVWLDRFCDYVRDRTAVIVTHRFTTAMRADLIYVLDQGRVVEAGNHRELLALDGLYAASWKTQVQAEKNASHSNAESFERILDHHA